MPCGRQWAVFPLHRAWEVASWCCRASNCRYFLLLFHLPCPLSFPPYPWFPVLEVFLPFLCFLVLFAPSCPRVPAIPPRSWVCRFHRVYDRNAALLPKRVVCAGCQPYPRYCRQTYIPKQAYRKGLYPFVCLWQSYGGKYPSIRPRRGSYDWTQ